MFRIVWESCADRVERRAVAEPGREPDYRFTLANERTFLAWIRTSLAFLAAGVAVRQLLPDFAVTGGRTVLAAACVLVSGTLAIGGWWRWRAVQRAMRVDLPLPRSWVPAALVVVIAVVTVLAMVLVTI